MLLRATDKRLDDAVEALAQATTPEQCFGVFQGLALDYGYDRMHFSLGQHPSSPETCRSWAHLVGLEEFSEHYFLYNYIKVDRISLNAYSGCRRPVDMWEVHKGYEKIPIIKRMLGESVELGVRQGFHVPNHDSRGLNGWGLGVFSSGARDTPSSLPWDLIGASYFLGACVERLVWTLETEAPITLPLRVLECLKWVALGKTSWEIGEILGISERTAVYHVEVAKRRLGVHSRQHAAAKALALGLIRL